MKNIFVTPGSPWRRLFPLVRRLRHWAWKFHDRAGQRFVISGGPVAFLDAALIFPENVALSYATHLFWDGPNAYENPTSQTIARLAGKARLFLDIGSNVGIYAVYVGVKFPQVAVFAFEPIPAIWEKNRAFLRANHLPDQITRNLALSDRDGVQKIFLPVYTTGLEEEQTATLNERSWQIHEEKVETFEIQCLTLDTFATQNELPAGACCVKIDVENFEAAVLRGGKKFFQTRRPWIVCELLAQQETDLVTGAKRNNNQPALAVIDELGYAAFAITADGFFRMNAPDFDRHRVLKDFLLIPREKISEAVCFLALEDLAGIFAA